MGTSLSTDGRENNKTTLLSSSNGMSPSVTNDATLGSTSNGAGGSSAVATANPQQPAQPQGPSYSYDPLDKSTNLTDLNRQSSASLNVSNSLNNNNSTPIDVTTNSEEFKFNLFGTHIYPSRWLTLPTLYSWLRPLSSLAMIIGCVMPYVPQYITIFKYRDCSGFSTYVCLTLLLANILRISFWFGHPFEIPLLVQSVIMILVQILLLELCVRVKRQNKVLLKRRTFLSLNPKFFWRWTDLISYIEFLCLFTALLGLAMYFLIDCEPFVEAIGYLALVTESMLGLPQVIKNFKKKSVQGMSLSMVLMWLGGDMFKTGYFIANNVPLQFWLCGLLQITIDLLILFQVCLYRQNAAIKKNFRLSFPLTRQGT